MNALVEIRHGEALTTSLAIAEGVQMEHASVIKLVRTYVEDLQEFGPTGFEIQKGAPLPQGGFARATEFAWLNEPQSTLLITYMRNSDIVRAFKKALVRAFFEAREVVRAAPAFPGGRTDHGADLAVDAERTFRSFLRAARSAGMALPAALRVANDQTLRRTGMDMLAEIGVDPDRTPSAPVVHPNAPEDPIARAVANWAATAQPDHYYHLANIVRAATGLDQSAARYASVSVFVARALTNLGFKNRRRRPGPGLKPCSLWSFTGDGC